MSLLLSTGTRSPLFLILSVQDGKCPCLKTVICRTLVKPTANNTVIDGPQAVCLQINGPSHSHFVLTLTFITQHRSDLVAVSLTLSIFTSCFCSQMQTKIYLSRLSLQLVTQNYLLLLSDRPLNESLLTDCCFLSQY